jgi:beta-glucosidase
VRFVTDQSNQIDAILAEMTLAEKIGQMTQASNDAITPEEVTEFGIGSILSGGNGNPTPNTPDVWADMVGSYVDAANHTRLGVPLLYGVDAVHGHSNVGGATVFPHNIGLGSAGDEDLMARIGRATSAEMLATGVSWAFAPTLAVPQDIRWGRTYEGYGRDPSLVASLGAALIRGLQSSEPGRGTALACAKHFVGDGATTWGTAPRLDFVDWWDGWGDNWQIDQGDARISEQDLRTIHLRPYIAAIEAGVMTVMASYNSWNGVKLHAHRELLTDVLKGELGFEGFVVSDWMGVDQLDPSYGKSVALAINAGVDMVMVPDEYVRFINALEHAVSTGAVRMHRIDDAVRRILRAKAVAGVFDTDLEQPPLDVIGSGEHRELAAEAVRRSAVLLKNDGALPITAGIDPIHLAGEAADDIGLQCGGWTVGWQGGTGRTTSGTTLLDGLRALAQGEIAFDPTGRFADADRSRTGIVCIAEPPYAEGPGDSAEPDASAADREVFAEMRRACEKLVLVIYSGRPLAVADLVEQADAVVAAWLPGSEAGALAEVLTGRAPFTAHTSQPWPKSLASLGGRHNTPLYPVGHGLERSTLNGSADLETATPPVVER